MSFAIRLTRDDITPDLARKLAACSNTEPVMLAGATELLSITKRSFRDPALRQSAWPAKKDGTPSNLIDKGMLISSIRVVGTTATTGTIGTDRVYGAIHQLGGTIRGKNGKPLVFTVGGRKIFAKKVTMPARPFFPFTRDGKLAPFAVPKLQRVLKRAMDRQMGK